MCAKASTFTPSDVRERPSQRKSECFPIFSCLIPGRNTEVSTTSSPVKWTKRQNDSLELHNEVSKEPEWQPGGQLLVQLPTHKIGSSQPFCIRNIHLGIRFYICISEAMKRLRTTGKSGTITIRQCLSASTTRQRAEMSASPDSSLTSSPGHLTCLGNTGLLWHQPLTSHSYRRVPHSRTQHVTSSAPNSTWCCDNSFSKSAFYTLIKTCWHTSMLGYARKVCLSLRKQSCFLN